MARETTGKVVRITRWQIERLLRSLTHSPFVIVTLEGDKTKISHSENFPDDVLNRVVQALQDIEENDGKD